MMMMMMMIIVIIYHSSYYLKLDSLKITAWVGILHGTVIVPHLVKMLLALCERRKIMTVF